MIRLLTLGSVDLRRAGTEVRSVLSQPKRLGLLVYLASASPRGFHSRDTLLALFWPEASTERARNALRQSLHYLRRSLGEETIVGRGDWEVGVDASLVSCDAAEFDDALAAGDLELALALYRGDFLPGFFIEEAPEAVDWLDGERRRRRLAAVGAARTLSERSLERGEREAALLWARRAATIDPGDEAATALLARLEAAARAPATVAPAVPIAAVPAPVMAPAPGGSRRRRFYRRGALAAALAAVTFYGYQSTRRASAPAPALDSQAAIAVLPFVNMSGDRENEYFSDGITDEILNALVQLDGLRVAARTSSFAFKGRTDDVRRIADQLGVQVVLEGSVRKAGERIRITAQLIDARNGYHLWSETYDRGLGDVFAAQEEIARAIAQALRLRLERSTVAALRRRPTADPRAYDLYLRGRYLITPYSQEQNSRAIEHLQDAIARDPSYAAAHAALARAYIAAAEFVTPRIVLPQAKQAALRALELDSTLVETRLALATVRQVFDRDWRAAEAEIRRALQLDVGSAEAHAAYTQLLMQSRRFAEAERERTRTWEIRRAEATDTMLPAFRSEHQLAWANHYLHVGQHRLAYEHAQRAARLDPENALAYWMMGTALQQLGRPEEAVPELERARTKSTGLAYVTHLGRGYALAGRPAAARAILDTLLLQTRMRYVPKDQIALLQLALGDTAQALGTLEQAIDDFHWYMPSTNSNPVWRGLWGQPRFEALMRKLGAPLPPSSN